ncbi:MAG: protein jag [Patescibacteria group bacterium]
MLEQKDIRKIEKISVNFFEKISSDIEVNVEKTDERNVEINAKMDKPQVLIGENGQTLKGTERLLRLALRNNIDKRFYITLDINDYKKKKRDYLEQKAREAADEVSLTGVEKRMPALPASERRIIHIELENREDVKTESVGEEPERQVVIKPA